VLGSAREDHRLWHIRIQELERALALLEQETRLPAGQEQEGVAVLELPTLLWPADETDLERPAELPEPDALEREAAALPDGGPEPDAEPEPDPWPLGRR
jgi:hypothetical protein